MANVDLIITAGQSNMQGVGVGNEAPATDPALCWDWDGGPGLLTVDDPESSTSPYKPQTGSMLPQFTNSFTATSERPVVLVRCAIGGTALLAPNAASNGDWSETGTLFDDSVTRAQAAMSDLAALGHTIETVNVVWSQGHRDAVGGNDLHLYQAAQEALVDRWRTALSEPALKVYIELLSSTSANGSAPPPEPNWQTVRDAQTDAAANKDGLEMAFDEGPEYHDRGWLRWDNLHYSQTGYNHMGFKYAEFMVADLGLTPPPPPPPPEGSLSSSAALWLRAADAVPAPTVVELDGSGTWTVPADVHLLSKVEAVGVGGSGEGGTSLNHGEGGGGGAYAMSRDIAVTPSQEIAYDAGAATVGGEGGGDLGEDGAAADFGGIVIAAGGKAPAAENTGGVGGQAADSTGDVTISGEDGFGTGDRHGGAAAGPFGGAGGVFPAGDGGTPGGGGAGSDAATTQAGDGSAGRIRITYWTSA